VSLVTPRDPGCNAPPPRPAPIAARHTTFSTGRVRVDAAVASRAGPAHRANEDGHSALHGRSAVFVVADGVGGGAMASCASRELVLRLHASLDTAPADSDTVRAALIDADRSIARTIATHTALTGAATVALCAGVGASLAEWLIAWVGDCRAYRVCAAADAPAELLTVDDTYRSLNETPPQGGSLDDPARMVGNGAVGAPNVRRVRLDRGDMLVLCSDGVHKHANADDIGRMMRGPSALARRCARLVDLAHASGGRDDATALVVRRGEPHPAEDTER
jgi:serine/threonine protein phosphatase PrpC